MREISGARGVIKNSAFLAVAQGLNFITPLIVIPYLTRTLGPNEFGIVGFALALYMAGAVFVDFGFFVSGAAEVAPKRNDKRFVGRYYTAVTVIRLALVLPTMLIALVIAANSSVATGSMLIVFVFSLSIVAQAITPMWLYMAFEQLPLATVVIAISKLGYLFLVLNFVENGNDLWVVATAHASSTLFAGFALSVIAIRFGANIRSVDFGYIRRVFLDAIPFFMSRLVNVVTTSGSAVVVGMSATPVQVSYYAAADQMYRAIQGLANSVQQSLFPVVIRERSIGMVWTFFSVLAGVGACIAAGVWVVRGDLAAFVFGEEFSNAGSTIGLAMIALAINVGGTILSYPLFGALGRVYMANRVFWVGGALHLSMLGVLLVTDMVSADSVLIAIIVTEAFNLVIFMLLGVRYSRGSESVPDATSGANISGE